MIVKNMDTGNVHVNPGTGKTTLSQLSMCM